jgi:hypothetical protein
LSSCYSHGIMPSLGLKSGKMAKSQRFPNA